MRTAMTDSPFHDQKAGGVMFGIFSRFNQHIEIIDFSQPSREAIAPICLDRQRAATSLAAPAVSLCMIGCQTQRCADARGIVPDPEHGCAHGSTRPSSVAPRGAKQMMIDALKMLASDDTDPIRWQAGDEYQQHDPRSNFQPVPSRRLASSLLGQRPAYLQMTR